MREECIQNNNMEAEWVGMEGYVARERRTVFQEPATHNYEGRNKSEKMKKGGENEVISLRY